MTLKTFVTSIFIFILSSAVFQSHAAVNNPASNISIGQKLILNGEQFVKVNNNGLLMMTSTYSCPHGKKIAGEWVVCYRCDNDEHGYFNYTKMSCDCYSGYNYRSSDTKCIVCPSNSSWSTSSEVCKCNANYYMQGDNANCQSCPEHSSSSVGSTSVSNCFCDKGYYLSGSSCAACPAGATTQGSGSTSISACICGIGYAADSGTNSCIVDTTNYSSTLDAYYDASNCSNPVAWMDQWTGCSSLATHDTVCLADPRDHRTYRVRKLADGKCWQVDSLRFGGDYGEIDGCSANSGTGNFSNGGSRSLAQAQETFSTTYYGHCRAINSTYNNYLYDWVAAMQSTLAYYGSSTTFSGTQQGICPTGWHIPTGSSSGEFGNLYSNAYNYDGSAFLDSTKGNFALSGGAGGYNGSLYGQGNGGSYWSSSAYDSNFAYYLDVFSNGNVYPDDYWDKYYGLAVRCVQD
ncbi:hypothetical protein IJJ27_00300 [bacterium]|nr:hypothetical protein [bacterium]